MGGFWEEFFKDDDKPAFGYINDETLIKLAEIKHGRNNQNNELLEEMRNKLLMLEEENRELKRLLVDKRTNAIETEIVRPRLLKHRR